MANQVVLADTQAEIVAAHIHTRYEPPINKFWPTDKQSLAFARELLCRPGRLHHRGLESVDY
jgi:hypothetical protein